MKRNPGLPISFLVAILIGCAVGTPDVLAEAWPPANSLDLKQVALFKNGLGFFVAETVCPSDRTDFRVVLPASPAHGSLWISYAPGVDLASVVAREVEFTETVDAITIQELLEANQGRKVTLTVGDDEITGVVTYVARNRDITPADPYTPGGRTRQVEVHQPWNRIQAGLAMVQTDTGLLGIDPRTVTRIFFAEERIERRFGRRIKKIQLDVHLDQPAGGQRLAVTFLAKGISWAPSYMIDISDEQRARLSGKAVILNDACRLDAVEIQLVTGFPHLQFSDIVSPLAMKENLAEFLKALNRGGSERVRSSLEGNVMYQNVAYAGGRMTPPAPEYGTADTGVVAEDLFLYPAGRISLDRNETAYIPLFTESVPYEHVYQWTIPDYVNDQERYNYEQGPLAGVQEVWHSLRLTNTSKVPWTTAPGETLSSGALLGQDTLKYTPPGGEATLRITRAIGIKADQIELETDRKRNAIRLDSRQYDLVTIEGELSVRNTLGKPVTLEITKTLSGEAKSVDPQAKQEKLAKGLRRVNPQTRLTWTIDLAPGQEKSLSYTYTVYVR